MRRPQSVFMLVLAIFLFTSVFVGTASGLADTQTINQVENESDNSNTTESLIVRFEPYDGGGGVQTADAGGPDIDDLKRHANDSQEEFKERFGSTGGVSTASDTNSSAVTIKEEFWIASAALVEIDTEEVSRSELLDTPGVERVHENFKVSIAETSASKNNLAGNGALSVTPQTSRPTTFQSMTGGDNPTRAIAHINVPEVWNTYNNSGGGVRVAVIDTGVNPNHPDIDITNESDRWVCYIDCSGNPDGPHDVDGHGTHVSGTIVGGGANDENLDIGVAPNATLMHAKGLGDDGSGYFSNVTNSMQWAVKNNADILSMSLGWPKGEYVDAFIEPVQNAQSTENGTIVIAASGNDGPDPYSSTPGNVYDATAVGSIDIEPNFGTFGVTDNEVSGFSNGEIVYDSNWSNPPNDWPDQYVVPDVVAPGSPIWSADTNINTKTHNDSGFETEDLTYKSGTSMATPHVAGVAALMQAETQSDLTPGEIKSALRSTANKSAITDPDRNDEVRKGEGLIDAMAAVEEVQQPSFFNITINEVNNTVTEGENITINYTVENTGGLIDTQDIGFRVNGTVEATEPDITLDDGETYSNTFTYTTVAGDAPAVKLNVSSANDTAVQITTVEATSETTGPAGFISRITADNPTAAGTAATGDYTATLNETVQANVTLNLSGGNLTASNITDVSVVNGTNETVIDKTTLLNGTAVVNTTSEGKLNLTLTFDSGVNTTDAFKASINSSDPNIAANDSLNASFFVDTTATGPVEADFISGMSADEVTADGTPATGNYTATLNEAVQANVTLNLSAGDLTANNITDVSVINGTPETTVNNSTLVNGDAVVNTTNQGELGIAVTFDSGVNASDVFTASINSSDPNVAADDSFNRSFTVDTTATSSGSTFINGTVTNTTGSPIANVGVYVENQSSTIATTTNSTGDYSVAVAADTYTVIADGDPNYTFDVKTGVTVSSNEEKVVDFSLNEYPDKGTIEGRIVDSDGNPVSGVTVDARETGYRFSNTTTTDANGNFTLSVRASEYFLRVQPISPSTPPQTVENITVTESGTTDVGNISFPDAGYITGTVTNSSGSAAQNIGVVAEGGGEAYFNSTNATGGYNITVPTDDYVVSVFAKGQDAESKDITVTSNSATTADFTLKQTKVIHKSVEIIDNGSGSVAENDIGVEAAVARGMLQAKVVNSSRPSEGIGGAPHELETLGAADDTKFRINMTVTNFTASSLMWGINNSQWSTSPNGTNTTDITVTGTPVELQVDFGTPGNPNGIGPLVRQSPSDVSWETGREDRATDGRNKTIYFGIFDLSNQPTTVRNNLKGMSVTTNAQRFSTPRVTNNALRVWIAAPTKTTDGRDHRGFYQAEIPQAQLDAWGVTDPETDLNALYKGQSTSFNVTDIQSGARIRIDNISYSAGEVEVTAENVAASEITSVTADNPTADGTTATGNYTVSLDKSVQGNVTLNLTGDNLTDTNITDVSVINGTAANTVDNSTLVGGTAVVNTSSAGELDIAVTFDSGVNASDRFTASINSTDTHISADDSANQSFFVNTTASSQPEYMLEFNENDTYAFGSPGPTDQNLTQAFEDDLTGFNGSIYVFDSADGSWTSIATLGEVELNALQAYAVVVDNGSTSVTIQFAQSDPARTASRNLSEGFNFITPTRQAQAGNSTAPAFETTQDTFTVLNSFAQPSVVPGEDEDDFDTLQLSSDPPAQVNPFAGYFVSASGGTALSDVTTGYNQTQADDALNVTSTPS